MIEATDVCSRSPSSLASDVVFSYVYPMSLRPLLPGIATTIGAYYWGRL
jgi:hypothetical protein